MHSRIEPLNPIEKRISLSPQPSLSRRRLGEDGRGERETGRHNPTEKRLAGTLAPPSPHLNGSTQLPHQRLNQFPGDIGQAKVAAFGSERQLRMVDPEQMQQ